MTDIAKIGLAAETADLTAAIKKLDQLSVTAAKAELATKKLEKTQASAALAAARGADIQASAAYKAATAANGFDKTQRAALHATAKQATASLQAARALDAQASAALNAARANEQVAVDAQRVVDAHQRISAAMNDNSRDSDLTAGQMQSNFTNVAAQFQDIFVTAASDMNPLMVGLQQGAQIAQSFIGATGGIGESIRLMGGALAAVLSPVSLFIIALVTGVVALVQWVDWAKFAKTALLALADIMPQLVTGIALVGGTLALAFAPQILTAIWSITVAIGVGLVQALQKATVAMVAFALANPFAAIVIAIAVAVAAAIYFRDAIMKYIGIDTVVIIKDAANSIMNFFIGAYAAIKETWSMLPAAIGDIAISAANNVIRTVNRMVEEAIITLNPMLNILDKLGFDVGIRGTFSGRDAITNPYAGAANKAISVGTGAYNKEQGGDRAGQIGKALGDFADWADGKVRGFANGLGAGDGKADKASKSAGAAKGEKTEAEKFADIITNADKQARALAQAGQQIGVYGEELAILKHRQELFNAAQDAGIDLTQKYGNSGRTMYEELTARAIALGKAEEANRKNEFWESLIQDAEKMTEALKIERGEIGLGGAALEAYRYEMEMLNKAKQQHIDLTPAEIDAIKASAAAYGEQKEAIHQQKEALDFAKDSARGFMGDMFDGLKQGKSLWETFGNAVLNVLDRIINKMLDMAVDSAFGGGSGGGFLGALTSAFGGMFGGSKTGGVEQWKRDVPNVLSSNANLFAKGGTFTNGIVNSPTAFYAKGGTPGVMGEAGPEAIVPLKRGPDGSLGVQMHRGGGKGGEAAPAINISNNYQIEGAISSPDLVAAIRQSGEMTQQQVKRQLQGWLQTIQRDGTIV